MKILTILFLAVIFAMSALAQQTIRTQLDVRNKRNEPALKVTTPSAQTANMIEVYKGDTLKFNIPATGILPITRGGTGQGTAVAALTALGIQGGTVLISSDGTATNTFTDEFSTAPKIVLTPTSAIPASSNQFRIVSSTADAFVAFGHTNVVYNWIAIQ